MANFTNRFDWCKVWHDPWLHGSIRWTMTTAERGVWIDLLALASDSPVRGVICSSKNKGVPVEALARLLFNSVEDMQSAIAKCTADGRIQTDEYGCIHICNWERYQGKPDKKTKQEVPPDGKWAMATRVMITDPPRARRIANNLVSPDTGEILGQVTEP